MALALAVVRELEESAIAIDPERIKLLERWFREQVSSEDNIKEIAAQLNAEASAEAGIPFLAKFLTRLTASLKSSSVYKESLRNLVKKTFTQFAAAFNELVLAAEAALKASGRAERLLLIVDGTDKIPLADDDRLFVLETEQLLAIRALVLYTAPITLKYGGTSVSKLDTDEVLPIIKLQQRDGSCFEPGWQAMRQMLALRIAPATFAEPALMDKLIGISGGHPRELLRLLRLACELTDSERIDAAVVERAIQKLSADFRYWLQPADYAVLAAIDAGGGAHVGDDEITRNLLWRLALLHYNDGSWRASHPAVRLQEGYRQARQALESAQATKAP